MTSASAPGKVILLGEHAVVYGRPAIAAPVPAVRAHAQVVDRDTGQGEGIRVLAPDVNLRAWLVDLPESDPLAMAIRLTLQAVGPSAPPALDVQLHSDIPIAAGLGSGAAVSVAITRALSRHLSSPLPLDKQSEIAYQVEKLHHGTPSGIDNTVVTYAQPVYFVRGQPTQVLNLGAPLSLVIADTGDSAPTGQAVAQVRQAHRQDPEGMEALFDEIGAQVEAARRQLARGDVDGLAASMNANQALLRRLGVSSPSLERLIETALAKGALAAKLSGGGLGGNMIALVTSLSKRQIAKALRKDGALTTIEMELA